MGAGIESEHALCPGGRSVSRSDRALFPLASGVSGPARFCHGRVIRDLAGCGRVSDRGSGHRNRAHDVLTEIGPDLVLVRRVGQQLAHGDSEQQIGDKNSQKEQRKPPLTEDRSSGGFPVVKVLRGSEAVSGDGRLFRDPVFREKRAQPFESPCFELPDPLSRNSHDATGLLE